MVALMYMIIHVNDTCNNASWYFNLIWWTMQVTFFHCKQSQLLLLFSFKAVYIRMVELICNLHDYKRYATYENNVHIYSLVCSFRQRNVI